MVVHQPKNPGGVTWRRNSASFWDHCCHLKCDEKKGNVYGVFEILYMVLFCLYLGGRAKAAEDLLQRSQYSAAVGDRCV